MITDLQDDVVTPNVMQLGDKPLTDFDAEGDGEVVFKIEKKK